MSHPGKPPPPSKIGLPTPGRQVSKIGVSPGPHLTNRGQAMPAPQIAGGGTDSPTETFTYFTQIPGTGQPSTQTLYSADRTWAKVTLMLETAGPVAVGTATDLSPVLGGVGVLLPTNIPMSWSLAKGSKLFIASTSINRVKVQVEPIPWLSRLASILTDILGAISRKAA